MVRCEAIRGLTSTLELSIIGLEEPRKRPTIDYGRDGDIAAYSLGAFELIRRIEKLLDQAGCTISLVPEIRPLYASESTRM